MLVRYILKYGIIIVGYLVLSAVFAKKYAIPRVSFFPKEYPPRQGWNPNFYKNRNPHLKLYQFLSKHYSHVNWSIVIFSIVIAVWMFFYSLFPLLLDIPFERNSQYCVIEGVALNSDTTGQSSTYRERIVRIEDSNGTVVLIRTAYTAIYEGNTYLAYYLPNSGVAPVFRSVN